ncbi:conserved Plasmodium protein, unknown function [Plasmodium knowlesi strain H]|uniref:Transmembrane protein n=3 Tax=Plasmodium knowlesi TaxID=5850 RepID=A0A5K1VEB9_PLAKH|nr:conserved Plasmodium protein, unknown function [Plasmodium knowlesi strain H]OTN67429.1 Uncharacterized protein PKNOH_S06432300 [Plasmodium knowlesi]CAA9987593.1 conserved Plasmodium protein, unknown function [Plasmodium knowlesi strain H]SBO27011.1 conserved Plasmodium protein, unknown function [Plasmodium knowlesi strain H]SBO29230.1 conserved Plasmodium protein, unknown function [Plasmodium knowlesi strain H]VVS77067.1 conserved Plasmodium protein, unknown function [Plasmodium knowlesi s|eukprot:XP_002258595.1 hypothetical protein, conserved in Plasmodium species [Plasmodium knowlesi strain H]
MRFTHQFNKHIRSCIYVIFLLVLCAIGIQLLKYLKKKYPLFLKNDQIVKQCTKIITRNKFFQQNLLYRIIKYSIIGRSNYEDRIIHRKNASFYYLKRAIFFLHNYKFLHIKKKLQCLFIRNNITDIRNLKYLTYKKVIQFKKDINICLVEAYNSFSYKNKKELLYIYFKLYSKIFFFFQSENIYFFHFLTHVLLVSWVYTPLNQSLHGKGA